MPPELVERGTYGPFVIEVHEIWWPSSLMQGSFVSAGHGVRWRNQVTGWCFTEFRFLFPTPHDAVNHALRLIDA